MVLPIFFDNDELDAFQEDSSNEYIRPTKTYKFDFNTGKLYKTYIYDDEAIQQAVIKALLTERDKYYAYSEDYGSELYSLFGQGYSEEYLKLEVPRLVKEALIPDERIDDVTNFEVTKTGDTLYISFTVITTMDGNEVPVEVNLGGI